jgi:hypothetical protein
LHSRQGIFPKQEISEPARASGSVNKTRPLAAGAIAVALALVLSFSQVAAIVTFVGEPSDWTYVGAPVVIMLGATPAAQVTLENHVGVPVLGIVLLVLRNGAGQTVYYTDSSISLTTDDYGTVVLVAPGVAPGTYTGMIFAMTLGGLAISSAITVAFAVSN